MNRNLFIFQNVTWSVVKIVKASFSWVQQFESCQNIYKANIPKSECQKHFKGTWVHLFSNGVVERAIGNASVGGVIRDQAGNWILGYNRYLGNCTPFDAEL